MERTVQIGNKKVTVRENFIDRMIEYFDPARAGRRLRDRVALEVLSGSSYVGASRSKRSLSQWSTTTGSVDADTLSELETLRSRSRDLVRNAPLATGAINTVVTNVVGTGLRLQPEIDQTVLGIGDEQAEELEATLEREFNLWAESTDCDTARTLNFAELQELAFRQVLENGDVLAYLPRIEREGSPYSLRCQMIEADRVCNKNWAADSATLSGGVERDELGAPKAYHVLQEHPGERWRSKKAGTWQVLPAFGPNTGLRNVLHLYRVLRPGQARGVPYLAPVIDSLKQLDRYTEAELMAAVVSGMFTVFVKTVSGEGILNPMQPTSEVGGATTDEDYKLGSGAIVGLGPNEDIATANPGRPNAGFDPFVEAILRQIGVALELPFEVLIKHFTASYSASRAALLEAWRFFLNRRGWLASVFCQPVYEVWLYEAVAIGRIAAPGYFADPLIAKAYAGAKWVGPSQGQIDPVKEVQAAEKRLSLTLTTRAEETVAMTGGVWKKNVRQVAKERALMKEAGIPIGGGSDKSTSPPANEGAHEIPEREGDLERDETEEQEEAEAIVK